MGRLLKSIFWLVIFLAIGVVGYAYLGDLTPQRNNVVVPVELDES